MAAAAAAGSVSDGNTPGTPKKTNAALEDLGEQDAKVSITVGFMGMLRGKSKQFLTGLGKEGLGAAASY